MLYEVKKGFFWGLGASVAVALVLYSALYLDAAFEGPGHTWTYEPQFDLSVSSYTYRIVEDRDDGRVLMVSGEIEGVPVEERPGVTNHILVDVEVRDVEGVFLGKCSSTISYKNFKEHGRRWFDAHCEPPESKSDIGEVRLEILHKYEVQI